MNSLIVFQEEGWGEGRIVLVGERAREVSSSHVCQVGRTLHVALYGGDKGSGVVREVSRERVVIDLVSTEPSLALRPIDLIVGLSRPQTNKKVIQAAVMAGVRSLHLVHLHSGEKSYLDSHILQEQHMRFEVAKALEQIGEGQYPVIHVHRDFRRFMSQAAGVLWGSEGAAKVVAHPGVSDASGVWHSSCISAVIAVGSERGWSEGELRIFEEHGFCPIGLGQRVVRVEVALVYLLGQTLCLPGYCE